MTVSVNKAERMKKERSVERIRNLLTPLQVVEMEKERSNAERWLKTHRNSEFSAVRGADETFARRTIRKCDEMLRLRKAPVVDEMQKDKMARRVKYLEQKIKEGMPTRDEMMGKRHSHADNPNSKYEEAVPSIVSRHIAWSKANDLRVKEWKRLKRILEPDNPEATNVEMLRKIH